MLHHLIYLSGLLQIVRGEFIFFFNDIFDALCKLSADSDPSVQSAAHVLDGLVKVSIFSLSHQCYYIDFFISYADLELYLVVSGYCDGKRWVQVCVCVKDNSVTIYLKKTWLSWFALLVSWILQRWGIRTSVKRTHERFKPLCSTVSGRMDHCSWQCSRLWYARISARLSWW